MSLQGVLFDQDSPFLRGVNEGYRTWYLRYLKIQHLLAQLKAEEERPTSKVEMRIQQLKTMTVGQFEGTGNSTLQKLGDAEVAMKELAKLTQVSSGRGALKIEEPRAAVEGEPEGIEMKPLDSGASSVLAEKPAWDKIGETLDTQTDMPPTVAEQNEELAGPGFKDGHAENTANHFQRLMHSLDLELLQAFEDKHNADMDLKEFEQEALVKWQEKKRSSEYETKRHAALTGMQYAMRAVLARYEWQRRSPEEFAAAAAAATLTGMEEADWGLAGRESGGCLPDWGNRSGPGGGLGDSESVSTVPDTGSEAAPQRRFGLDKVLRELELDLYNSAMGEDSAYDGDPDSVRALSEVLVEGVTDPKQREEILKREHVGSQDHPHGCRACHFQGGLCWKGLSCSFCHICPKPKRKSKHQRDVDKRRQERYRQVKDDLGIECLDELTKIDDSRRQIMMSSEELKKRVKDAYATESGPEIHDVKAVVSKLQLMMDTYHASVPFLLGVDPSRGPLPENVDGQADLVGKQKTDLAEQHVQVGAPDTSVGVEALSHAPSATTEQDMADKQHTFEMKAEQEESLPPDDKGLEAARWAWGEEAGSTNRPAGSESEPSSGLQGIRGRSWGYGQKGYMLPDRGKGQGLYRGQRMQMDGWPPPGWGRWSQQHRHEWLDQGHAVEYGSFPASDCHWWPSMWGGSPGGWGAPPHHQ